MPHPLILNKIGGPREGHRVSSPEEYALYAKRVLNDIGASPLLKPGQKLHAYVSAGWWVVKCPCGNAPAADPEWGIAICCECGAQHEAVFPNDREKGEAALLERPDPNTRHWFPHGEHAWRKRHHDGKSETVADLRRENKDHADERGEG